MRPSITFSIFVCAMLVLPGLAGPCSATLWIDAGDDHAKGQHANTSDKGTNIRLNSTGLAGWDLMDYGIPYGRSSPGLVYDPVKGSFVLFGGVNGVVLNDTWYYDQAKDKWVPQKPPTSPVSRYAHLMDYDSLNGVTVMTAGRDLMGQLGDIWAYNSTTGNWTKKSVGSSPWTLAESSVMVYDSAKGMMVIFCRHPNFQTQSLTLGYNYSNNTRFNLFPINPPGPRDYPAFAYDSDNHVSIMFGGHSSVYLNDTWKFDTPTHTWTQLFPASPPAARYGHEMTYDASSKKIILFGGANATKSYNDTWSYDAGTNTWTELKPASAPSTSWNAGLTYDSKDKMVLLYGGSAKRDTWRYYPGNNTWSQGAQAPFGRDLPAMAFDSKDNVTVLFGGHNNNDTWTYDLATNRWKQMWPKVSPPRRERHSMVYDSKNDVMVTFGADCSPYCNDTWTYSLKKNTWTDMKAKPPKDYLTDYAMAFDEAAGVTVIYGGYDGAASSNTYAYDYEKNTWTDMKPATNPGGRIAPRMVYDTDHKQIIMYGSSYYTPLNDTWVYSAVNNTWTKRVTNNAPPPTHYYSMAYDSMVGEVVLFGGDYYVGMTQKFYKDTWTFNPDTNKWTKEVLVRTPPGDYKKGIAYDPCNRATIVYGGMDGYSNEQVWALPGKKFVASGDYTSQPFDTGGASDFGSVRWNASVPKGTALRLQVRSADSQANLSKAQFVGPDGKAASFFLSPGTRLPSSVNGSRWVQYKAFLNTSDDRSSPSLSSVNISYNVIPALDLTSPSGGVNWTGLRTVAWNVTDLDKGDLRFDLDLINTTARVSLIKGLGNSTRSWSWNTANIKNGTYRIVITAKDNDPEVPLAVNTTSKEFRIAHPAPPNRPPTVELIGPLDDEVLSTNTVMLSWNGSDPDKDNINYTVFLSDQQFSAGSLPAPKAVTPAKNYSAQDLADNSTYYWTVRANDGKVNGTVPAVRHFSVKLPSQTDHPPVAQLVGPGNGSALDTLPVKLSWSGSDPDGDKVSYYVLVKDSAINIGTDRPIKVTNSTSYDLSGLTLGKRYYWTVVPFDGKVNGSCTNGPWWFDVKSTAHINHPPVIAAPSEASAQVGVPFMLDVNATDADNDAVVFSLVGQPTGMTIDGATGIVRWTPLDNQLGEIQITIKVTDGKDAVTKTIKVIVTKPKPNARPVLGKIDDRVLEVGQTLQVQVNASDADAGDHLAFGLIGPPTGMSISPTGLISWTPTSSQLGTFTITVSVSDGKAQANATFKVTVNAKKTPHPANNGLSTLLLPIIIVVVAVCAIVAAIVLRKRRKATPQDIPPGQPTQQAIQSPAIYDPGTPQQPETQYPIQPPPQYPLQPPQY